MLKEAAAIGLELVAEHGSRGDVLDRGEDLVSKLIVVVLEDRGGHAVDVRVDRVCCIVGNLGKSGVDGRVASERVLVKASVCADDGFTSDGIRGFIDRGWVVPAVWRAWHVSFELSGLAKAEDDDFAVVVDDTLRSESVKVRCTNRDGGLKFFNVATQCFVGAVPVQIGDLSVR